MPTYGQTRLLFIASIGNKAPYRTSRHSAGHILLDAVEPLLVQRTTSFTPRPIYEAWHSPSYMNESGPGLVRQLDRWMNNNEKSTTGGGIHTTTLAILHDELEVMPGKLRVKRGGPERASLRGHRGLSSVIENLGRKGLYRHALTNSSLSILRIGVGIGRPLRTRNRDDVARYVLTNMTPSDVGAVRRAAGEVVDLLVDEIYNPGQEV